MVEVALALVFWIFLTKIKKMKSMESEKSCFKAEQKEQPRKFEDLAIITTTFYKEDPTSRLRSQLAIDMLETANRLGIKVVVVDGGSNEEFLRKVRVLENVTLCIQPKCSGMGESRRQALETAINLFAERRSRYKLSVDGTGKSWTSYRR